MTKYKTLGHTPGGIEVQRSEDGFTRLCRGANIVGDEYEFRFGIGDVIMEVIEDGCGIPRVSFSYTLLCEGD